MVEALLRFSRGLRATLSVNVNKLTLCFIQGEERSCSNMSSVALIAMGLVP